MMNTHRLTPHTVKKKAISIINSKSFQPKPKLFVRTVHLKELHNKLLHILLKGICNFGVLHLDGTPNGKRTM